jgi:acetyl-CoA C-acetyltransferase
MSITADERNPCIIGIAQAVVRKPDRPAPEPLELWHDVAVAAVRDANAAGDVLGAIDSIGITHCQSWPYDQPTLRLSQRLGITCRDQCYAQPSGTTGQHLVERASRLILKGHARAALLCGAEAIATLRALGANGDGPGWSHQSTDDTTKVSVDHLPPGERASGLLDHPGAIFALWDTARRAHLGIGPTDYRQQLGELLASMTTVAAKNPSAWFQEARDASELITAGPDNRMVAYPYTKRMMAVPTVDMAAALIVTSHAEADALGVPLERRVYLRGSAYAEDPEPIAQHPDMWRSEAMKAASAEAMRIAEVDVSDIAYLDLYSCFPSSINFARDALGVHDRTGDMLTVTGGLPYAGGPYSNYMIHSIAAMCERLREDSGSFGMVSGVGMALTHHAFGVYSAAPPHALIELGEDNGIQAKLDQRSVPDLVSGALGPATVAAYTIAHDRDGEPARGMAVCDLPSGARCYAWFTDSHLLVEAERSEFVGQKVALVGRGAASEIRA